MKGRVEPEPTFDGEIRLHDHVGDQEAVLEEMAGKRTADHLAHIAVRAVAGDHPVGLHGEHAVGRFHGQTRVVLFLGEADDLVLPAQLDQLLLAQLIDHVFLQIVLLEVDRGCPAVC